MIGARTGGREAALKMLFGLEATEADPERAVLLYWREFGGDAETRPYADETVLGVMNEREQVDEIIRKASEHWRLERMTRVDRNVLRLGTWELLHRTDVPRRGHTRRGRRARQALRERGVRRFRQRRPQSDCRKLGSSR